MATYEQTRFWATHNSYSGDARRSLVAQLDGKVRCLELDFWDNDYDKFKDYRVGHLKPGSEVALGNGNPDTLVLKEWLKTIANWSAAHAGHAPITLVLDVKSDLTDNETGGDLEDLNQKLDGAFGTKLFTRDDYDSAVAWPELDQLRDRVLCVLSGNSSNRTGYRYCFGGKPAIAVNSSGDVLISYRSGAGDMRYWTGKAKARAKRVEWHRKGTYAWSTYTVSEPSIAMAEDGWVVSVHRIGPAPNQPGPALLESRVGQLQDEGWINWYSGETFTDGMEPSVVIEGTNKVREIHTTPSGKNRRLRVGTLNRQKKRVDWKSSQATQDRHFPRDVADWQGLELRCLANAAGMILHSLDGVQGPVRYRQIAFVEVKKGEDGAALGDPRFFAADADNRDAIARARNSGLAGRGWGFLEDDKTTPPSPPQENAPATDRPFDQWYEDYMNAGGQAAY